jgi:hypothetical protein
MRALTLWQPYASLVAWGGKIVENRTWLPPTNLLGERFAIHAGAARKDAWRLPLGVEIPEPLPRSALVATAIVVGALDLRDGRREIRMAGDRGILDLFSDSDPNEALRARLLTLDSDPWWLGPVGWLLEDIRPLRTPVPAKGMMGLWTLSDSEEQQVLQGVSSP